METRTYERKKLYKEIWAEPMTTVAKRYGISDVALRKQCKKLDCVPILIKEKQQRVEHKTTEKELADKKRYSWVSIPPYDLVKTGRLIFEINECHAKRKHWRDTDNKNIEDQIGEIIIWVMEAIQVVKTIREERVAEEIQRAKEEQRRRALAEKRRDELEQLKLLEHYADDWYRAEKIRRFADSVEIKIAGIENQGTKEKMIEWLKWARNKADWLDPLNEKEDELLEKRGYFLDVIEETEE